MLLPPDVAALQCFIDGTAALLVLLCINAVLTWLVAAHTRLRPAVKVLKFFWQRSSRERPSEPRCCCLLAGEAGHGAGEADCQRGSKQARKHGRQVHERPQQVLSSCNSGSGSSSACCICGVDYAAEICGMVRPRAGAGSAGNR